MKKRKCFKGFNFEKYKNVSYFVFFIFMLAIIPISSENLAKFILMIEVEVLTNVLKYILTTVSIFSYLIMLIENMKGKNRKFEVK